MPHLARGNQSELQSITDLQTENIHNYRQIATAQSPDCSEPLRLASLGTSPWHRRGRRDFTVSALSCNGRSLLQVIFIIPHILTVFPIGIIIILRNYRSIRRCTWRCLLRQLHPAYSLTCFRGLSARSTGVCRHVRCFSHLLPAKPSITQPGNLRFLQFASD